LQFSILIELFILDSSTHYIAGEHLGFYFCRDFGVRKERCTELVELALGRATKARTVEWQVERRSRAGHAAEN
jgi:hypothetical protein